jgi:hypothetical protein
LCSGCQKRLADLLREIPTLYSQCESQLVNSRRGGLERIRGGDVSGIALRDEPASARTHIVSVLASWAALVADERPVATRPPRVVPDLAGFLLTHLAWLAAHPAVGDAVDEFLELVDEARAALGQGGPVGIELGSCSRPGCEHPIRAVADPSQGLAGRHVCCGAGHVVPPHEWLMLRHGIDRRRRTLPVGLAALAAGVQEATVRKWASRGKLTRYGKPGRSQYDVEEIFDLISARNESSA